MTTATKIDWHIQPIQTQDLPKLVKIEKESNSSKKVKSEFKELLSCPNNACILAVKRTKTGYSILGFLIYKFSSSYLQIIKLSVDSKYFRNGIASGLINCLIDKLDSSRNYIEINVCETNLPMHLVLKKNQFIAKKIIKEGQKSLYFFKYEK